MSPSLSAISLAFAIVFTAVAQVSYKMYFIHKKPVYLFSSMFFFVCTPLMAYLALLGLSLSTVYVNTGITYVLVMVSARYIVNEVMSFRHISAAALIVGGVVLFNS